MVLCHNLNKLNQDRALHVVDIAIAVFGNVDVIVDVLLFLLLLLCWWC